MAGGGGHKKRFQYCTDSLGQEILYLRALQGHSGLNLIDLFITGQCVNSGQFLRVHLPHRMCDQFTLHHKFRIDTGRTKFGQGRQTVFFTAVNLMNKEHKDPYEIDLNAPRLAWYKQRKWKRHQDTLYWVDVQLAQQKGLKFYRT